ncbi:ABC transporter permease [Pararcticibacter amylolyticus]|nr:ABC transporter permease [Pararcticibacter amylolyticus]
MMNFNNIKVSMRYLIRNKSYTLLNMAGLSAGIAVALMIGLWVHNEYSYDKFLNNYDSIYQVRRNYNSNGDTLNFTTTSLKLADALKRVPGIEFVAETDNFSRHTLKAGEKKLILTGGQVASDFLKLFDYKFVQGNASSVLSDPYSIVLTAQAAKRLFGEGNAIEKLVRFDNMHDLKVTGILEDIPYNSSLQFDFLVPFSYMEAAQSWVKEARTSSFSWNSFNIYIKLKDGTPLERISSQIRHIEKTETDSENAMNSDVILQPLKNWHLYGEYVNGKEVGGFVDYVRMFSLIGISVLIIACINFINLSTARAEKRAKEVGVRKVSGSDRLQLIILFLTESLIVTIIAAIAALVLVYLALPTFNQLAARHIHIPFYSLSFWSMLTGLVMITALFAGSRPAFLLSSFSPVQALKSGSAGGKGNHGLSRQILVVIQFCFSIALIIGTIIVYRQIEFVKNRPLGYNRSQLMVSDLNSDLSRNYPALKNELLQQRLVENITQSSSPATDIYWHSSIQWPGMTADETVEMGVVVTDPDYFATMQIPLKEGRNFRNIYDSTSVIFNEAAIKRLRLKAPLGKTIQWQDETFTIAGIARDAIMGSPFAPAEPTMFLCRQGMQSLLLYRLAKGVSSEQAIARLNTVFNKYSPAFPYQYAFTDDDYAQKFNTMKLTGKLSVIFSVLAIVLSSLGLVGLAAYIAEKRTKEIGIRRVLGASAAQIWTLLSREFFVLVLISCLIASPLSFYFLNNWLAGYSYRISIQADVFAFAGIMAVFMALMTTSFYTIRAACRKVVKSIRSE